MESCALTEVRSHPQFETVLAAYLQAEESGETLNPQDWLVRYPGLADELKEFFDSRDQVPRIWSNQQRLTTPCRFGNYELLEEIAHGGMGVVYKARQLRPNRMVALKLILSGQLARRSDVERFHAEAQAAASLDHPNIVPIYEVGQHAGQHYFTMKLIEGGSLAGAGASGQWPVASRKRQRMAAQLLATVARAVHYAHQRGILHRDLKPANILLDAAGVPYVSDFGLAKQFSAENTETLSGAIVGTASYMAPEQAAGCKSLTTAADVYSLGAILYELLTARPPFKAESSLETLLLVRERDPVSPRAINPHIDRDLETICLKCLEKDSSRRYNSAEQLADDLDRWLAGDPIVARPTSALERTIRRCRKNPLTSALAAAVVLVAAIGFIGILTQWQVALASEQRANEHAVQAQTQAAEVSQQRDEAQKQRDEVKSLNQQLLATQEKLRGMLYASDMNQAKLAWDASATHRVYQLLQQHRPAEGEPDRRGFEWHYLNRLYRSNLRHINTGQGLVVDVSLSPDGKRLAIASLHRRNVRVLDVETGQAVLNLPGHTQGIFSVAFSSDGKLLASGSGIAGGGPPILGAEKLGEVRIWNAETGDEVLEIKETGGIEGVALSPDGTRVAGAGFNKSVRVWDVRSGTLLLTLTAHTANVQAVAYSPDGKRLASAASDKTVKIWDAESGEELLTLKGHEGAVIRVAYSPDGRRLASSSYDHTARIWDAESGQELYALRGHTAEVPGIAFSPDGKLLASAAMDRTVKIWDVDSGAENVTYRPAVNGCAAVAFSRDGKRMICLGFGSLVICDAEFIRAEVIRSKYADQLVVFSPDSNRMVTAGDDTAVVWDVASREQVLTIKDTDIRPGRPSWGYLTGVAYSPDGRWPATTGRRGADPQDFEKDLGYSLKIWDAQRGALVHDLSSQIGRASPVAFSPDGKRLAAAGFQGDQPVVHIWDVETAKTQLTFRGHKERVYGLAFSPDGRRIASVSWTPRNETSKNVIVWDAATGEEFFALDMPRPLAPRSVAFSPDGQQLALGSFDRISLISAETGAEIRNLSGHTNQLWQVQFHPDGKRLVTTALGGSVSLWDTHGGQEVLSLTMGQNDNPAACFSPDGHHLAITCRGVVKILDATPLAETTVVK